jgi:hypothetical protein
VDGLRMVVVLEVLEVRRMMIGMLVVHVRLLWRA